VGLVVSDRDIVPLAPEVANCVLLACGIYFGGKYNYGPNVDTTDRSGKLSSDYDVSVLQDFDVSYANIDQSVLVNVPHGLGWGTYGAYKEK
jgi:hypothetical protein